MRVLGALYGVTLVISSENTDVSKAARKTTATPSRKSASKRASAKKSVKRTPPAAAKAEPVAPSAEAAVTRSEEKATPRSAGSPSNAELRSWARQNGFTVSDRGRLPASVVTAYRNAAHA